VRRAGAILQVGGKGWAEVSPSSRCHQQLLAFAIVAEKHRLESTAFPAKRFDFLGGLTEATETILAFVAMCQIN